MASSSQIYLGVSILVAALLASEATGFLYNVYSNPMVHISDHPGLVYGFWFFLSLTFAAAVNIFAGGIYALAMKFDSTGFVSAHNAILFFAFIINNLLQIMTCFHGATGAPPPNPQQSRNMAICMIVPVVLFNLIELPLYICGASLTSFLFLRTK